MRNRQKQRNRAFTLIELLVVMAIISALVGILSVGLKTVKMKATALKQKGEFHGLEVSLELFYNDFARYPESAAVDGGSDLTCGAQHLAEAMEGRDEKGYHPKSKWHPDLEPTGVDALYTDDTLKARMPVYFELKHSGFYTLEDLWGTGNTGNLNEDVSVLTDVFVRNEPVDPLNEIDGKVGSPVLYFRAEPTRRFRMDSTRQPVNPATKTEYVQWIYNFDDNIDLLKLPYLRDPDADTDNAIREPHYPDEDNDGTANESPEQMFYESITQRAEDTNNDGTVDFYKPHNKDTFILISAGWDGIYGTDDDLTNFNY